LKNQNPYGDLMWLERMSASDSGRSLPLVQDFISHVFLIKVGVRWKRLWTRFYESVSILSNGKNFDKGSGISIKVAVIMRIVAVIGEKWDSLETSLPFEIIGGFIVTPSRIKALEFSLYHKRALASLIFLWKDRPFDKL
jgi:hypothetical protein